MVDLNFEDGGLPQEEIAEKFLEICDKVFRNDDKSVVGVHCIAGLGRSSLLVCIGLIEFGLKFDEAVELVRSKRKGAINAKQLKFLKAYKPQKTSKKCIIM